MTTLGTKTLGESPIGTFEVSFTLNSESGSATDTTVSVLTGLTASSASGVISNITATAIRTLQVKPGDTTFSGVGAAQLGASPIGEVENATAGAKSDTSVGIPKDIRIIPDEISPTIGSNTFGLGESQFGSPRNATASASAGLVLGIPQEAQINTLADVSASLLVGIRREIKITPGALSPKSIGGISVGGGTIGSNVTGFANSSASVRVGVVRRGVVTAAAGSIPAVILFRGGDLQFDHLFVALAEADVASVALGDANSVSVALGLRRRGQNPQP